MSSDHKIIINQRNGRKSSGPRTAAGKARASRNALQHGLAAISRGESMPSGEIARLARAIRGDDHNSALLAQAKQIAQNEMVLRAIREQQIAVVERVRDRTTIALAKRDNTIKLRRARLKQARQAAKQIELLLPKVLKKYRNRLQPVGPNLDPWERVPLCLQLLLKDASPEEEQRALDLAREQIEQQQRDEHEALKEAIPDLIRLERYERRAWSRQQRAIREFLNIKFTGNFAEVAGSYGLR